MSTLRLYKYLSISKPEHWQSRRKLIADRELYFTNPAKFNDPLDCTLGKGNPAQMYLKPFQAFCLSREKRDDSLMFSHYGDSHRGFRLTFEVSDDKTIGESSPLALGQPVQYKSRLPNFNGKNIHKMPYTKSLAWKYEAEYRVLKVSDKKLTYPPDSLIEVAFGYRMNRDFESVIRRWVKCGEHKRVKFLRAAPSRALIRFKYIAA